MHRKRVISEDTWNTLTGENIDVLPGTYLCITNQEETALSMISSAKHITNMVTRTQISTQYAGLLHYDLMTDMRGYCVVDNTDYALLSEGLTDDWKGRIVSLMWTAKTAIPSPTPFFTAWFRALMKIALLPCTTIGSPPSGPKNRVSQTGRRPIP